MSIIGKSVEFNQCGDWKQLKVVSRPVREPIENEVRVKMDCVALNRAEELYLHGKFVETPIFPHAGIGYEGAGIVEKIGKGCSKFKVGDRVSVMMNVKMAKNSTQHEYAIFPEKVLVKHPDNVSQVEASTMWMAYQTAYYALVEVAKIKKDDYVVVTAASSSAGMGMIQVAKAFGAKVMVTSRTTKKKQAIMEYGADHFIATNDQDIEEEIMKWTNNKGANIIIDPVGGPYVEKLANATAYLGTLILYGLLSPDVTPFPIIQCWSKYADDPILQEKAAKWINEKFAKKEFKSIVGKVFKGIDSVPDAYKYLDGHDLIGKVVIEFTNNFTYTEHANRRTVTAMDVVCALKKQGRTLYGFNG
ncbi:hypothetical protein DFA_03412 [Cavenderia fasciculata]|uniref:Enoyl reductase (ER) domain-containing protein n=1 Tax=Cavenderia fasciculata TaxID=261658 RepID=F4PHI0_CACFS|nr:uncharacterized protein DFA_03412 [Cavenderia fasciculata]EGG25164.1 hypothetical protein DFA_03412 [Cavenderia fasciculata]|eukprot:XP_004363015.1 hypothetical protein DFA_03412 [Cavenderia fasciculata]